MARLSPFVSFGLVLAFLAWLCLSGVCLAFLMLAKQKSFVFSHRTVNSFLNLVYKRVCRNCAIPSCGVKYLVRLANHLADVDQLDHIQRRQYFQEAKLEPKIKVVVYESEADNSGKITELVLASQYRQKKRCTNCQDHEEMKPLLKQKLKEQLQRTRQTERNKESRTLGLEAIGKLCRDGRIIYYSS